MLQSDALTILKTGASVFLTGEPGSGKTHVITEYVAWLRACGIEPSVAAATGIAATHVGGMTVHAWSGIGILDALSPADLDRIASKEPVVRRVGKAKVLIIDEISMLSASTLDSVDAVCREVRRDARPFGGLQVILVGDFFQLPPIAKAGRETAFAYDARAWQELHPLVCYLTEQHRQEDSEFLALLTSVRSGEVEELHFEKLSSRRVGEQAIPEDLPKLFSHNMDVDRLNAEELAKLPGKKKVFTMTSRGKDVLIEGLKRGCLSPETLELKEGAVVMCTKNSPQGNFVNGTLGVVVAFDSETGMPVVELKDGRTLSIESMEWQVEEQGKILASIVQVPLRLAWAMTVHKSQGMSMDAAVIDLSRAFEYGQGYVALSRVRTLSGIHLLGINERALRVHPDIVEKDREFHALSEAAEEAFAAIPREEIADMHARFVEAMGGAIPEKIPEHGRLADRFAKTLAAVRQAKSLSEAAKARGITMGTILTHLEKLGEQGALSAADIAHMLPSERVCANIRDAIAATEGDRLAPIFAALKGAYSYETIRLVRLALRCESHVSDE